MKKQNVPEWVKKEVQKKIDNNDISKCGEATYEIHVFMEDCGRFECTIEAWKASIACDTWDYWDETHGLGSHLPCSEFTFERI